MNETKWLKEGKKTQVTSAVKACAESIQGEGFALIENIATHVRSLLNKKEKSHTNVRPDARTLSADDILKGSIVIDCISAATLFRALCIARGIPAVFVETLQEEWTKNPKLPVEGHIFVDVEVEGKWQTIDPSSPQWLHNYEDYSSPPKGKYIVVGKGLDSFDLGYKTMKEFIEWAAKKYKLKSPY